MLLLFLLPFTLLFVCSNDAASIKADKIQGMADDLSDEQLEALTVEMVANITAKKPGWNAKVYEKLKRMHKKDKLAMTGALLDPEPIDAGSAVNSAMKVAKKQERRKRQAAEGTVIPPSFDTRSAFPKCAEFTRIIRDQSNCGSCWAVATGSVVTDRLCIETREKQGFQTRPLPFLVSEADILSCSSGAPSGNGCQGGYVNRAMIWVQNAKVVSGSNYTNAAAQTCKPYPFPPLASGGPGFVAPSCVFSCQPSYTWYNYTADKTAVFGSGLLGVSHPYYGPQAGHMSGPGLEQSIQQEVMTNGPVVATMQVYDDFDTYHSGIYKHTVSTGKCNGGPCYHAVRVLGWGQGPDANGATQKYWLVANSWNTWWGEQGLFRILRGTNECGIESTAIDFVKWVYVP